MWVFVFTILMEGFPGSANKSCYALQSWNKVILLEAKYLFLLNIEKSICLAGCSSLIKEYRNKFFTGLSGNFGAEKRPSLISC